MSQYDFSAWNRATAELSWGAQRVLHETLKSVAENGVSLTYGSDFIDGRPCLINAAAHMLADVNGVAGVGKPMASFGDIVSEFDTINRFLRGKNVNTKDYIVSPLAAEILLANFAPLKEQPEIPITNSVNEISYREPSDADFARDWILSATTEPIKEETRNGPAAIELTELVEVHHEPPC